MKRKTLYTEQYIDCEYDIDFEDLLELIESCDSEESSEIRKLIGSDMNDVHISNLYDEQKLEILKVAFNKYNLEQLQEKLNIKNGEY